MPSLQDPGSLFLWEILDTDALNGTAEENLFSGGSQADPGGRHHIGIGTGQMRIFIDRIFLFGAAATLGDTTVRYRHDDATVTTGTWAQAATSFNLAVQKVVGNTDTFFRVTVQHSSGARTIRSCVISCRRVA